MAFPCHSDERAIIGSTFVARLAGTYAAAKETKSSSAPARDMVRPSAHDTPNSRPEAAREKTNAATEPTKQPNSGDGDCLAKNEPQDIQAGSSQRHANPKFVRAFRYGVRDQSVRANCGKNKGDSREHAKQPCLKTPAISEPFKLRLDCRNFKLRNFGAKAHDRAPYIACKRNPDPARRAQARPSIDFAVLDPAVKRTEARSGFPDHWEACRSPYPTTVRQADGLSPGTP